MNRTFPGTGVLVGVILAACNAENQPAQKAAPEAPIPAQVTLTDTQWNLEDLAGKAVIANSRATLTFPEAGKVAGQRVVQPVHRNGRN